jgi:hypothetical protein
MVVVHLGLLELIRVQLIKWRTQLNYSDISIMIFLQIMRCMLTR